MTTPRPMRLPSFEEINKKKMGGSDFGGLNRPNPYFDNPLTNRNSNYFARTFTGPARPPVPTVAPIPEAVHQITGRHAGAYIEESAGAHVADGRRVKRPEQPAKDVTPGRHRAETRGDRVRSAISSLLAG